MMGQLKISVLDVGHGDFIYAQTPYGSKLVIDCGTGDIVPSICLRNVPTIDELQVSHPHTDHFDDIIAISRKKIRSFRCPALNVFDDKVMGRRGDADQAKIDKLRQLWGTIRCDNGAVPVGGGFSRRVWAPAPIDRQDPNTASLVTLLSFGPFKMLLGGDLPDGGWQQLVRVRGFVESIKDTTIFKVPHHGREEGI